MAFLSNLLAISVVLACSVAGNAQNTSTTSSSTCDITNVCFLIDQSGSIRTTEYEKEKNFVNSIATELKKINQGIRLSATAFASSAVVIQEPTTDLNVFTTTVNGPRQASGGTAMSAGLSSCYNSLKSLSGNRIIVLVTDGAPNSKPSTTAVAKQIRSEKDMYLVTVAVQTGGSSADFLKNTIAHSPQFAIESEFAKLPEVVQKVVQNVCTVVVVDGNDGNDGNDSNDDEKDCVRAYKACIFKFKGELGLAKYDIAPDSPDRAFTPPIVPKDSTKHVGVLNTNGIVPEFLGQSAEPITSFGSQRFTPTHFKPFWISKKYGSGIGHQTFHGDQATLAMDKCVRVYFTSFQVINNQNGSKNVVENRSNVPRSENACVVFRT